MLQGDHGLSQKRAEPGNASYYYSLTHMPTAGTIQIGGTRFEVNGLSWMDREWSTSGIGKNQVGWDWFALQLDDGRDLMFYRLRLRDGSSDSYSAGTLVSTDGTARTLRTDEVTLTHEDTWRSLRRRKLSSGMAASGAVGQYRPAADALPCGPGTATFSDLLGGAVQINGTLAGSRPAAAATSR